MNDIAAAPVEKAAEIIKRATDVEIRDIYMPMLVRPKGLDKACALFADLLVPPIHKASFGQYPPCAGRTYGNDIPVEHHEGEPSVAFKWVIVIKADDGLPFPLFQPEIPRNGGVMLIGFAIAIDPGVELAFAYGKPADEPIDRDAGLIAPCTGEVNYGVSGIMGNPNAC